MPNRPPRALAPALPLLAAAVLGAGPCARLPEADAPAAYEAAPRRPAAAGAHAPPSPRLDQLVDLAREARALEERAVAPGPGRPTLPLTLGALLDRAAADSARAALERLATMAPEIGDWLRLRAAAIDPEPARRARTLARLTLPAARERALRAEGAARARTGDAEGAAAAYDSAGRPATALALRLAAADARPDSTARRAARDAVRATLLRLAAAPPAADTDATRATARDAAALLDSAFAPLRPDEALAAARALAATAPARAATNYAAAFAAGLGDPADRMDRAAALLRAGRARDAALAYGELEGGAPALAATAGYQRARALLRADDGAAARATLRAVAARYPDDSAAAGARYLLADLATDDGRDADARADFLVVAQRHATSPWAPRAAFRAAIIALAAGDAPAAAAELDAARERWPDSDERNATEYWAGRAWSTAGDEARARQRWEALLARDPDSYYAMLAAARLGRPAWVPPAGAPIPADTVATAAGRRAALLERLGFTPEAGWERDWLARWADGSTARMLAAAAALVEGGRPGPGIRLARRAIDRDAPRTAAVYRLAFPLRYQDILRREATARGIDPAFAAALVKQESNFTADATSPAGARGLMQLMPDVGRAIAGGGRTWDAAQLYRPEVNIPLGMRHLAAALSGYPHPAYALAAYNAGQSRVARWRTKPGAADPELFVERIPYAETRDYVRIILRSRALYRDLYEW